MVIINKLSSINQICFLLKQGSAFRCFKTGDITDPVLEIAAHQSGVPVVDILENLPNELSVWMDPGEVSYRIGEKGVIKILYSAAAVANSAAAAAAAVAASQIAAVADDFASLDHEVSRTFNPEAQCFKPIDTLSAKFANMMGDKMAMQRNNNSSTNMHHAVNGGGGGSSTSDSGEDRNSNSDNSEDNSTADERNLMMNAKNNNNDGYVVDNNSGSSTAAATAFLPRAQQAPLNFTAATFAQTKFGSTKLKTNSKRTNR